MKKLLVFASILALAAVFIGCDDEGVQPKQTAPDTPAAQSSEEAMPVATEIIPPAVQKPVAPAAPADPQAVVVTVNGTKITEGQISQEVEKRIEGQKKRMPAGMEIPAEQLQMLRKSIVDMLVTQELIKQKLSEKKITVSDEQVIEEIKTLAAQQNQTLEDVEKEIAQYNMTMDDLKQQIAFKLQVDALIEAETKDQAVTEEDAKKFYDENAERMSTPEQVRASHILIMADAKASDEEKSRG